MDRNWTSGNGGHGHSAPADEEGRILLASRRACFDRLRSCLLDDASGPILLTGEEGAGKTWLWSQVERSLPNARYSVTVDLTSGIGAWEFLLLVGDGLGLSIPQGVGAARIELAAFLRGEEIEGRLWNLVVDEGQSASLEVCEEVRVMSNRLGRSGGFRSMIILAQSELARRFSSRDLAPLASRLEDHLHLAPLDVEEARALISSPLVGGPLPISPSLIEEIHRDSRGNPREIVRAIRRLVRARQIEGLGSGRKPETVMPLAIPDHPISRSDERSEDETHKQAESWPVPSSATAAPRNAQSSFSLIPSKPPIRLEDGLIEVGWQGDAGASAADVDDEGDVEESELASTSPLIGWGRTISEVPELPAPAPMLANDAIIAQRIEPKSIHSGWELASADEETEEELVSTSENENVLDQQPEDEPVDDRYAALQAWSEWARNRELTHAPYPVTGAVKAGGATEPATASSSLETDEELELEAPEEPSAKGVSVRAESQHEHAPYGQLFHGARPSRQF